MEKKNIKLTIAKALRIATVPPVMVTLLIVVLESFRPEVFKNWQEICVAIVGLALLPVAAYPLSWILPKLKEQGRDGQRKMAFILSAVGYLAAWLYAVFADGNREFLMICSTYLLSVIFLLLCNSVPRFHASGHACSVAGPLAVICYYLGFAGTLAGLVLYSLVFWSSVTAKRHTPRELVLGSLCSIVAFLVVLGVLKLLL